MKLDLDRLHAWKPTNARRVGHTVEACADIAGAVELLQPGEIIVVFVKYMDRVKHFTRTLFEVLQAMDIELPSRKQGREDLYFKHRDICIVFKSVGDNWNFNERDLLRGYPSDIQTIYDLD
jgi:hypothetical protein